MYNALFGYRPEGHILLTWLDLKEEDFRRYRDCYFSKDGQHIIVYTRCGGPNRKDYESMYTLMKKHPYYIKDYDDEFDSTYSSIEFLIPSQYLKMAQGMFEKADTATGAEKFIDLFTKMENGEPLDPRADKFTKNLEQAFSGSTDKQVNVIWVNPDGSIERE